MDDKEKLVLISLMATLLVAAKVSSPTFAAREAVRMFEDIEKELRKNDRS